LKRLGLIVNPIAGMGGPLGLKGTDGQKILEKAIRFGAKPNSPTRAEEFLRQLYYMREQIELFTYAGIMGEYEALNCGFKPRVLGKVAENTSNSDTKEAARLIRQNVDLLIFCGGDGTARDILEIVDAKLPILGIPAGVKMHSAVFALNPLATAKVVADFLLDKTSLMDVEIVDVDEEAYREGRLSPKLYGYAITPGSIEMIQNMKTPSPQTEEERELQKEVARELVEKMIDGIYYILGPGTTVKAVAELLGLDKTLLGVDILLDRKMIAKDANERKILDMIGNGRSKIVVSPIGNQFFIFGRGNQQISPAVIRKIGKDNIVIISTKNKIRHARELRVDTGDSKLDKDLAGYIRVVTGFREETLMKIE